MVTFIEDSKHANANDPLPSAFVLECARVQHALPAAFERRPEHTAVSLHRGQEKAAAELSRAQGDEVN